MVTTSRRILAYEAGGFGLLLVLLWADELFDLPDVLFGSGPTPTNVGEVLLESSLVLLLGAGALLLTARLLRHVRLLEGRMHVCGFCGRVRDRDGWVTMDEYLQAHSEAEVRHSFCLSCLVKQYGGEGTDPTGVPPL
jgi:hypothetical protein